MCTTPTFVFFKAFSFIIQKSTYRRIYSAHLTFCCWYMAANSDFEGSNIMRQYSYGQLFLDIVLIILSLVNSYRRDSFINSNSAYGHIIWAQPHIFFLEARLQTASFKFLGLGANKIMFHFMDIISIMQSLIKSNRHGRT